VRAEFNSKSQIIREGLDVPFLLFSKVSVAKTSWRCKLKANAPTQAQKKELLNSHSSHVQAMLIILFHYA